MGLCWLVFFYFLVDRARRESTTLSQAFFFNFLFFSLPNVNKNPDAQLLFFGVFKFVFPPLVRVRVRGNFYFIFLFFKRWGESNRFLISVGWMVVE
jgi:hypothetical protein